MVEVLGQLTDNYFYAISAVLFMVGLHTMLTHSNLIKKVIALNIMETSIFLFFVAVGYVRGGKAPIIDPVEGAVGLYINPLPSALILTGIVVSVSITAFALGLIVKLYQHFGVLDADEILRMIREQSDD